MHLARSRSILEGCLFGADGAGDGGGENEREMRGDWQIFPGKAQAPLTSITTYLDGNPDRAGQEGFWGS